MPQKSRWTVAIPSVSLPTLIFGPPSATVEDVPAFFDAEEPDKLKLSLRKYALWSRRLAAGLQENGLQTGDRVLIYSGNNIMFPVAAMGVIMAGGIATTANPAFVARELAYQLKDSEPRFLLAAPSGLTTALDAASNVGFNHDNIFVFDDGVLKGNVAKCGNTRHWKHLIVDTDAGREFAWEECYGMESRQKTALLLYSSGTSGTPKGCEITHYHIIANICQVDFVQNIDPRTARSNKDQRLLCMLPMYHALGLLNFATVAPFRRTPVYVLKQYSLQKMLEVVQSRRITELTLVSSIVVAMAKDADLRSGRYDLSSVRRIQAGAAPLSRESCEELETLWSTRIVNIHQGYGMTELAVAALGWDETETSTSAAVGEPMPNCEVKIMDDDEVNEVSPGERGELWCHCINSMKGYWKNAEATRKTVTSSGWVKTGDIAYVDTEGKYRIVDRKKELIKVKGNQVAPAELEGQLLEHPEIQDAAVIGIKKGEDEQPLAYVVKKSDSKVSADEILTFMNERTAKFKHITGGISFIDAIPKNPSGKILRRELRARVESDLKLSRFHARL